MLTVRDAAASVSSWHAAWRSERLVTPPDVDTEGITGSERAVSAAHDLPSRHPVRRELADSEATSPELEAVRLEDLMPGRSDDERRAMAARQAQPDHSEPGP